MTLDAPTLSLIRRVLCAHAPPTQPLSALLPPLTQHHPAIDLQLYALLAIICRDYIDTWYTPLSSDRALASELVRAAAALATELERRSTTLDLPHLLLDALPALVARHITDHRLARARAPSTHLTPAQLFHNLQPHPALAPAPAAHNYNKLLSHALLAALLPDATLPSPCARVFLRDLVAALALGGAVERMSEPAVMYGLIATLLERPAATPPPPPPPRPAPRRGTPAVRIPPAVESVLAAVLLVLQALRALGASLLRCQAAPAPQRKPLLAMAAVWLLPVWFGVRELQPWLWGVLCLLLRAVCVRGWVGAAVDGAVRDAVAGAVGGGGGGVVVAEVLGRVRGVVFPGNAPLGGAGGGVVEVEVVRGRAVEAIVGRVPEVVWRVWVGDGGVEGRRRWVREWCVDVWADKEVNRHLWYAVLDLLVAGLVPELVEGGEGGEEKKVGVEGQ